MGLSDSLTTKLYIGRVLSDIELKIQAALNRKLAVADKGSRLNQEYYELLYYSQIYPDNPPDYVISPQEYQFQLLQLHDIEKQLDTKLKKYETERAALTQELEGINKIVTDHTKNDFKIGSA